MAARVGCSGWQYRDWRGPFYPQALPQRLWLEHYAGVFDTVEVNNAFYRLPERTTFEAWAARTPPGFVVTVKGSRYLTHVKRLREPAEPVARLLDRVAGLGDRTGPLLLQLPPTMPADPALLAACLACFPPPVRVAVEPRHASWWTDEVRDVLTAARAALVWADRGSEPVAPLWRTADFGYLRLHLGDGEPWPRYAPDTLRRWADRLRGTWPDPADVYAYLNNDMQAGAPADALALRALLAA